MWAVIALITLILTVGYFVWRIRELVELARRIHSEPDDAPSGYRSASSMGSSSREEKPEPRDIVRIYGELWFNRATAKAWKRTTLQSVIDGSNSILYLTDDGKWVYKEDTMRSRPATDYRIWSNQEAWQWFLNTRFTNQAPDFLIELMKAGKR